MGRTGSYAGLALGRVVRRRFPIASAARFNHAHGCIINRQWLVAELLVLRSCFRFRGITDVAGPVAGTTQSRMDPRRTLTAPDRRFQSLPCATRVLALPKIAKRLGAPVLGLEK